MRLALRNLLSNALKFSPSGCAVIVKVTDMGEAPAVMVDVSDTAPGIPAQFRPLMFQHASQGGVAGGGLGAGAACRRARHAPAWRQRRAASPRP